VIQARQKANTTSKISKQLEKRMPVIFGDAGDFLIEFIEDLNINCGK